MVPNIYTRIHNMSAIMIQYLQDAQLKATCRKGAWSTEEDKLLRRCITKFGVGKWCNIPNRAGLNRCHKSCRLRWLNYLSPCIKRGSFSKDEAALIERLHALLGNRWSLITARLPGRTANDVKNYWNSHLSKKGRTDDTQGRTEEASRVVKPIPWVVPTGWVWSGDERERRNVQEPPHASESSNGSKEGAWHEMLQDLENFQVEDLEKIIDEQLLLGGAGEDWESLQVPDINNLWSV